MQHTMGGSFGMSDGIHPPVQMMELLEVSSQGWTVTNGLGVFWYVQWAGAEEITLEKEGDLSAIVPPVTSWKETAKWTNIVAFLTILWGQVSVPLRSGHHQRKCAVFRTADEWQKNTFNLTRRFT